MKCIIGYVLTTCIWYYTALRASSN